MLQRIQTVYLLIALILSTVFLFTAFAQIHAESLYYFDNFGITHIEDGKSIMEIQTIPILGLNSLIIIITLISIFLYKNRKLQIRLSSINLLLEIGIYGLIAYYAYFIAQATIEAPISWQISIIIPFSNAILIYLAIRAMLKDEALIKSLDRIR